MSNEKNVPYFSSMYCIQIIQKLATLSTFFIAQKGNKAGTVGAANFKL
jgi:hypothetical protein